MFGLPSIGGIVEKGLDALGAPEWVGDVASGATNVLTGNVPAAIQDGLDLLPNVARGLGQLGLPTDQLAPLLEYADDLGKLAGGDLQDFLTNVAGKKDEILGLLGKGKDLLDGPLGELLEGKLGDTANMLSLLEDVLGAKAETNVLTQALAIRG